MLDLLYSRFRFCGLGQLGFGVSLLLGAVESCRLGLTSSGYFVGLDLPRLHSVNLLE